LNLWKRLDFCVYDGEARICVCWPGECRTARHRIQRTHCEKDLDCERLVGDDALEDVQRTDLPSAEGNMFVTIFILISKDFVLCDDNPAVPQKV
jgi:hypothetical protein